METRIYHACELRALTDNEFALSGYAARFNQPSKPIPMNGGTFIELIRSGAFTQVLKTNPDVRCLFNHDESKVLGRTASGTLKLEQDDNGLKFHCQLDPKNSDHRNLHSAISRRDISECSFGFSLEGNDDDWSISKDGKNVRTIRNISHLYDASIVTHPAYDGTSVSARKAAVQNVNRNQKSYQEQEIDRTGVDKALETLRGMRYAAEVRAEEARERLLKSTQALDAALRNKAEEQRASFGFEVASDGGGAADPEMKFRCKSASTSSSAAEHRTAAKVHRMRRDKAKNADSYAHHDSAQAAHEEAAPGSIEAQRDCVNRCRR